MNNISINEKIQAIIGAMAIGITANELNPQSKGKYAGYLKRVETQNKVSDEQVNKMYETLTAIATEQIVKLQSLIQSETSLKQSKTESEAQSKQEIENLKQEIERLRVENDSLKQSLIQSKTESEAQSKQEIENLKQATKLETKIMETQEKTPLISLDRFIALEKDVASIKEQLEKESLKHSETSKTESETESKKNQILTKESRSYKGYSISQDSKGNWYAVKRIKETGKTHTIYIGRDITQAERKIDSWKPRK